VAATYSITILPSAGKRIKRLPVTVRQRAIDAIQELAHTPRPHGCKKLRDRDGYRIRVGEYRVIYTIKDAELVIIVVDVGHRRDIYT
jgi:mRNA interferase RelE/StbE